MKRYTLKFVLWIPLLAGLLPLAGCATPNSAARFSKGDLSDWKEQVFNQKTHYALFEDDGVKVLKAESRLSASALYLPLMVDLEKTPYINWRWKVSRTLGELDEQVKAGDDYPARVYVVISPKPFRLKPRSLNYVWASNTPAGGHWENAYSSNVMMVALRSGDELAGQWVSEKRNVREDLQRYFGEAPRYIEGIAIMSDTDDSKSAATAYYGDIYFTAE
jgi:hypothetical protein